MPPSQVIVFIIGTVVILFGCYYVTYFVGMKASGRTRGNIKNRNIKVVDRYSIARDKSFCVIEIAGKVYLVGITNNSMTLLDTLDAAAFAKMLETNSQEKVPWTSTPVGQYGNKLTRKVVEFFGVRSGKIPKSDNPEWGTDTTSGKSDFESNMKAAQDKATGKNEED